MTVGLGLSFKKTKGALVGMESTQQANSNMDDESGDYSSDYNNCASSDDVISAFSHKGIEEHTMSSGLANLEPAWITDNEKSHPVRQPGEMEEAEVQSQLMTKFRAVLLIGLLGILLLCSVGGYFLARNRDTALFLNEFQSYSETLVTTITSRMDERLSALESLSASLTSYARAKGSSWPFVTVEDSGLLLSKFLNSSKTDAITVLPIVSAEERLLWEVYTARLQGWLSEEIERSAKSHDNGRKLSQSLTSSQRSLEGGPVAESSAPLNSGLHRKLSFHDETTTASFSSADIVGPPISTFIVAPDGSYDRSGGPFLVSWQYAPIIENFSISNINLLGQPDVSRGLVDTIEEKKPSISCIYTGDQAGGNQFNSLEYSMTRLLQHNNATTDRYSGQEPFGFVYAPVSNSLDIGSETVGIVSAIFQWKTLLENSLPIGSSGVDVVVSDTGGQVLTYRVTGPQVEFVGETDSHSRKFASISVAAELSLQNELTSSSCVTTFKIYPSASMRRDFSTGVPIGVAIAMGCIIAVVLLVFWVYDSIVEYRHDIVMEKVGKTEAVISNMFPKHVVDRLVGMEEVPVAAISCARRGSLLGGGESVQSGFSNGGLVSRRGSLASRRMSMESMISNKGRRRLSLDSAAGGLARRGSNAFRRMSNAHSDATVSRGDAAIADFYPDTTVFFADIAGFTAWCSEREPCQVFTLLETLYNAFDAIASKKAVYKVETIGDCYMAVTGLPVGNQAHALTMCEFARECLTKMRGLARDLEIFLGPGTASLDLRIGIHSGPVVAGVLRTGNARFQLFGDTVNTAARMESTGVTGKIQISQSTAREMDRHGCTNWYKPREDMVFAKGKGILQTFWLIEDTDVVGVPEEILASVHQIPTRRLSSESYRLVDWVGERLGHLLKKIETWHTMHLFPLATTDLVMHEETTLVLPEVQEIVFFPLQFGAQYEGVEEIVEVDSKVLDQLKDLVHAIALLYPDNAFHNLAHASHVTMSVMKLLSRVGLSSKTSPKGAPAAIASDPLTQFACAFAAFIHDVDHPGVPNAQLLAEVTDMALKYDGKCIAESNSVNIAWGLLMQEKYKNLRRALFCNESEMKRFRQLLVNLVIATDIADPDLKNLRDGRWNKVFGQGDATNASCEAENRISTQKNEDNSSVLDKNTKEQDEEDIARRATIIIEHLILASDVSHMMQHFQVYRKWNEMFFQESLQAYTAGRAHKDPSASWYNGELWFFDNYIIPLAGKLKDCGAFGVSSDEYLKFALQNRQEWEEKGEEIVADMVARYVD